MNKKPKKYKIYSVRRVNRTLLTSVVLSVIACALALVLLFVLVLGPNDKTSSGGSSSAMAVSEVSSAVAQSEVETSSIAQTSSQASTSSKTMATSSASSKTNETSKVASVATGNKNNYGLPFDVYAEAKEWTYVVDKSKPVPLQPCVDNSFFTDAMFVGDSITTGIDLYNIVSNVPVVAYTGINSNTILTREVIKTSSGKVTFLQAMKKYNPKHIYIMLGINGIAFQSKDKFISGYSKFVDEVKKQHPNAVIYLQSILPVTAKKQSNDSRFANSKINTYNAAIAQLAKDKGVYYLNVAESFKDANGNLPSAASSDGIHFGTGYYRRWIEYLKRHTVYTGKIPTATSSKAPTSSAAAGSSAPTSSAAESSSSQATTSVSVSSEQTTSQ
ncbi:MAG: hypothetical protein E7539_00600 [Ruminococcaceae bacterium]|nr:hypothetical protein [Oscillospiraceae bacterium]